MIKNYFKLIVALVFVSNVMAQNVPSYVPINGLVGYWPFNGNANDESGNGMNGTVTGPILTTDRLNKPNSCYTFNVANWSWGQGGDIIYIPFNSKMNTTNISVSIWFNRNTDGTSNQGMNIINRFQYGYSNPNGQTWGVVVDKNSNFNLQTAVIQGASDNNQSSIGNVGPSIAINQWYHITFTFDGTTLKQYINGVLTDNDQKAGFTLNTAGNSGISIGVSDQANGRWSPFGGKIDDFGLWDRALTQQEITALYTGGTQSGLASTKVFVDAPATVNQNQEVELSISTEALNTADNVIAYQTDFSYDTTRYTYVGNNLTGTLNPSGNAVVNSTKNGKLAISYMSQTALNGTGSLVKLKFKANNTLGQGIFGLSNFLYNTTTVTSLKSDTVNTIDVTPPTAKITYSQNPVRKGDSLLITVKFNEKMADAPVPQLNLTGQNTLANTNLTKVNDTTYTYWWVVEKGNGAVNVNLASGKDLGGNVIVATPTLNPSFTVLPTVFGDIDTNKLVQAYDAALALQYSVGLNPLPTMDPLPWSNWRLAVANVDTVGNVSANDASLILQHSAKLITTFPADAKKRGGDAPVANVTVTQEGNQLVFRATGNLYAFNIFMKDNFNVLGQPDVKNKSAMLATNINATTYNVGLASTTPFVENEPFLVIPILTNENVQGTMDIVANTEEKSLIYGKAAGIGSINKEIVLVYPNPTKDVVMINNAEGKTLRIVDVQGKEVFNQKVNTSSMEVSMKAIATRGTYVLHILDSNNESVQTKQIVLE
jgi:hypothetical protein